MPEVEQAEDASPPSMSGTWGPGPPQACAAFFSSLPVFGQVSASAPTAARSSTSREAVDPGAGR